MGKVGYSDKKNRTLLFFVFLKPCYHCNLNLLVLITQYISHTILCNIYSLYYSFASILETGPRSLFLPLVEGSPPVGLETKRLRLLPTAIRRTLLSICWWRTLRHCTLLTVETRKPSSQHEVHDPGEGSQQSVSNFNSLARYMGLQMSTPKSFLSAVRSWPKGG